MLKYVSPLLISGLVTHSRPDSQDIYSSFSFIFIAPIRPRIILPRENMTQDGSVSLKNVTDSGLLAQL